MATMNHLVSNSLELAYFQQFLPLPLNNHHCLDCVLPINHPLTPPLNTSPISGHSLWEVTSKGVCQLSYLHAFFPYLEKGEQILEINSNPPQVSHSSSKMYCLPRIRLSFNFCEQTIVIRKYIFVSLSMCLSKKL